MGGNRLWSVPVPAPGQELEFRVAESTPSALSLPVFFRRPVLRPDEDDDDEATHFIRQASKQARTRGEGGRGRG